MRIRKRTMQAGEWIKAHRQELVRDLMALIRIRSVAEYGGDGFPMGKGCHEAAHYLMELAQSYGLEAENHGDQCISIFLPARNDQELGILAHLDVVEAGSGWRQDPFEPKEENGWIIGRGSCDCKGPLMMALYVLRCLKELSVPLHFGVRLIVGCDEEREMRDVRHYLFCREAPLFTLNCDGMWPVGIAEKGILTAEIAFPFPSGHLLALDGGTAVNMVPDTASAVILRDGQETVLCAHGKAAHCQAPSLGENAIEKLLHQLCTEEWLPQAETKKMAKLLSCFETDGSGLHIHYQDQWGNTTCVPTMIRFKAETIRLTIAVRHAPTQPFERLNASLNQRCAALGGMVTVLSYSAPRMDEPNRPEIRLLKETCQEVLGLRLKPYATGGGTHSRLFPRSVPFGIGVPGTKNPFGGPHEADEAVCIGHLLSGLEVYIAALSRLDEHFSKQILLHLRGVEAGDNGFTVE